MYNVKIGKFELKYPIIQGGMGVGISLSNLAGNVAKEGAMGVISIAQIGYRKDSFEKNSLKANIEAIKEEAGKARAIANGNGMIAVNIMTSIINYDKYVKAAVEAKFDAIICGAGLPLNLPELAGDDILIAPIVSSRRALEVIAKKWKVKYNRYPDFIVIEGSEAGGHLGFSPDDLKNGTCQNLEEILADCKSYLQEIEKDIPIFVAGGIYSHEDFVKYRNLGATGVQMGTRFVVCEESDVDESFKQMYINAKEEDVVFVKSPAGFLARAIRNDFTDSISENIVVEKCYRCLKNCNPQSTVYCITKALINAAKGEDTNEALYFCGSNVHRIKEKTTVKKLIQEIVGG